MITLTFNSYIFLSMLFLTSLVQIIYTFFIKKYWDKSKNFIDRINILKDDSRIFIVSILIYQFLLLLGTVYVGFNRNYNYNGYVESKCFYFPTLILIIYNILILNITKN